MDSTPIPPPGRGNEPEPSWEQAHETMEREREKRCCPATRTRMEKVLQKAESCALAAWDRGKDHIRAYPAESVGFAAATGYFWTRLPVGAMLATGVRVLAAFAPPVLAAAGLCAVVERLRREDEEWRRRRMGPPFPPPPDVEGL